MNFNQQTPVPFHVHGAVSEWDSCVLLNLHIVLFCSSDFTSMYYVSGMYSKLMVAFMLLFEILERQYLNKSSIFFKYPFFNAF
jgi:hypothetical protein